MRRLDRISAPPDAAACSNYLSYLALAVPRALALRPDIILAMTDPPVAGIAGALIARLAGRPFVYNIRDLYPDMAVGGDIVRSGEWVARWESLHRRALKQAARVIVLGDDMRDRILAKGVAAERVVVVRDGTTPSSAPAPPASALRRCLIAAILLCRKSGMDFRLWCCMRGIWDFTGLGKLCLGRRKF